MTELERLRRAEDRLWEHEQKLSDHSGRLSSLETTRDNERTRHSSTPAWIFGTIAAGVSIMSLLFNLYMAGVRP